MRPKRDEFLVDKCPTPFKLMCDEHEISYKDISLASGVAYHNLSKYALSVCKPNQETLAKLNEVCEPIFGRTLTLEDFGFQPVQEDVAMATDVETQNIASLPAPEPEPKPVPTPANDIRYARLKIECADNGFLLRDDVGNCWVADDSQEDVGNEIGKEIKGELDEAEKAIMYTDEWKNGDVKIWGWSVVVGVKAITDPRELHEFKDREI